MKIAVFGDGAWGTALAINLLANNHQVAIWGAFPDYLKEMKARRENFKFLPGVTLPEELEFESDAEHLRCHTSGDPDPVSQERSEEDEQLRRSRQTGGQRGERN